MTVAVAHHASELSERVLAEAVREAERRHTELVLVNVTDSLDLDKRDALEAGIGDVVSKASRATDVAWRIELVAGSTDIAEAILDAVERLGAEVLIIGSRRRSPMAKAFLGSVTQQLILEATVPVLVVKNY
ncbi:universal stress protein [Knoellia sp. S7-12]|uniref:universal stress protein n=1 Tax=Knoellia sp. S7-12 TaxID=3126698 RepID=UPI003367D2DF